MAYTGNVNNIPAGFIWQDKVGLTTKELGKAFGSQKLYANVDSVPPGTNSTKYHSHSQQEEFFYILAGCGLLRLNETEQAIGMGDFLAKSAGQGIAHTFFNSGTEPPVMLDIGTLEAEDACHYPDERMFMQKSNGEVRVFHEGCLTESWTSEPNS